MCNLIPANIMLPAQTVVFAFAVCLVAQHIRYKEPCYRNSECAVQQDRLQKQTPRFGREAWC